MTSHADEVSDVPETGWRRSDTVALLAAGVLVGVAVVVGRALEAQGLQIVLPFPPLLAQWDPHVGWGTPLTAICLLLGLGLQRHAARWPWPRLLVLTWLLNLAWMVSLTLVDGFHRGWIDVLLDPNEYLADLPRITSPTAFLSTFTHYIAFGPGVDGDNVWTTHVAGHPPLATLVFWTLQRIGLGGGFWAGALCILVSSVACVAVPVALRELGASSAARRLAPFAALFPGAVWMAVSADGLFAGVATGGLALVCLGCCRRRVVVAFLGGLLLGAAVFLNYGLILFGVVVVVVLAIATRAYGWRRVLVPALAATAGVVVVAGTHLALGFNWVTGLRELRIRYYQGIASQRPYSYFVWANLGAWLISCSPLLAVGVTRAVRVVARGRRAATEPRLVALVALSGVAAALIADLSGMSKAETERIWLAFGAIAYAAMALLRGRSARVVLVGCALTAILVNHLLDTGW